MLYRRISSVQFTVYIKFLSLHKKLLFALEVESIARVGRRCQHYHKLLFLRKAADSKETLFGFLVINLFPMCIAD